MDAVTYPDPAVIRFISEALIPLRVTSDTKPLSEDFNVKWTPTLISLSPDGKEHHRTLGFLEPEDLIASLLLGKGKYFFDSEKFPEALITLEIIISDYKKTHAVPEAIYLRGVSQYKNTGDPMPLKAAYEILQELQKYFSQTQEKIIELALKQILENIIEELNE